ncbi:MAG TPA: FAD-dependent oxidoreductase [Acidimicrobiales bacterium]|nr:FAD-dependent oxidoreductase [Acidimicrobiales bacterium]
MPLDPVHPRQAREIASWDAEADVVVVGAGCAGTSAAIEAARAGADVRILERAGGPGGASAMSGGSIYLGGGTPVQKACGFEDTVEDMFAFLMAAAGPDADRAKVELYCQDSLEHYNWIVDCGVPFKPSMWKGTFPEPLTDDGLMFTGGEDAYPFNELARPAARGHVPQTLDKRPGERSSGFVLMQHLTAAAHAVGARTTTDVTVERLAVGDDNGVVGVVARQFGEPLHVRARKGVVLSAGGFIFNDDMLTQHAPHLLGKSKLGTNGDDGRAIRMAQAVGAAVRHMDAAEAAYGVPELYIGALLVNGYGQRFINEDTYFGRVGQAVMFNQGGAAVAIIDDAVLSDLSDIGRFYKPRWICEDAAELGREMGLPVGVLEATVDFYNRHAAEGNDPLFHKAARWLRPLEPPLGAIELSGWAFSSFTLGGLHTDVDGRVLDVDGRPIPGLHGAGRTTSGLPAWGYCSGMSLGDGTFFGRRAGRCAARA